MSGPRVVLLAGEASGDHHGAALAEALRARWPAVRLAGMGGPLMSRAGVDLIAGLDDLAVMGFAEVVPRIPYFLRLERSVMRLVREVRADLVVPIDYPGFNMRVARAAHGSGHRVLYYIAPQVWAWRTGRTRRLAESTDHVAVILPFEAEFLARHGVRATYVGHPLLDRPDLVDDRATFCERAGLDPSRRFLALLPGSRSQELARHLRPFAETGRLVAGARPDVLPVFSRATGMPASSFEEHGFPVVADTRALLRHADAALVKSGTSTLEATLEDTPHVVAYVMSPLTALVALRLLKTAHVALPNLIAGERVVPEFIQEQAEPSKMARALLELLEEGSGVGARQRDGLLRIRRALGDPGAARRVVALAAELLDVGRT